MTLIILITAHMSGVLGQEGMAHNQIHIHHHMCEFAENARTEQLELRFQVYTIDNNKRNLKVDI